LIGDHLFLTTPAFEKIEDTMETLTNTQTAVKGLLTRYRKEAQGPGPLWAATAETIVEILEQKTPEEAVDFLAKMQKRCGRMTISIFYEDAQKTLKTALCADALLQPKKLRKE
jgi:hypothetical protein